MTKNDCTVEEIIATFYKFRNQRDILNSLLIQLITTIRVNLDKGHLKIELTEGQRPQFDFGELVEMISNRRMLTMEPRNKTM